MSVVGLTASSALSRLSGLLPLDPGTLSDLQLISLVERAEEASRHVEAVRLAAASEVAKRSAADAPDSLAKRLGYKTPAQAIEAITKSSSGEARKLVADATGLAKLPTVEAAVLSGRIGRDSATAIAGELKKASARLADHDAAGGGAAGDAERAEGAGAPGAGGASGAELAVVEKQLVELAVTSTADQVRVRAHELATELTPEVVEAQATRAMAERFFWLSPTKDGAARVSGFLPAGHAAVIRGVLDAYVNPKGKKTVGFVDAETGESAAGEVAAPSPVSDSRTAGQKRADLIRDVFASQARAAEAPDMGGDHPTVWLSTTVAELEAADGLAFYAGDDGPVPVADAAQAACSGGVQTVIFSDDGGILQLGREVRGFTRRQRRAIALRDGGTCLIPGCGVPAQWCEVHHVTAYKDGGTTDASNGVTLCWFHHREIDTGPWQVRMQRGTPEIRYAFGNEVRDWAPAGTGAGVAARLRARRDAPSGPPPGRSAPPSALS